MKQTMLHRLARWVLPKRLWVRLARLPRHPRKYVHRFGWGPGMAAFGALAGLKRGVVEVTVAGLRAPVAIRRGTSDVSTFEQVFIEQEYEIPLDFEPATIVDAGANVGLASVLFASRYPSARIIAIEPDIDNFAMLERNTRAYPNVIALRAALWGRAGALRIANPGDEPWAFRIEEANDGGVAAVTVEELLGILGTEQLDVLKMDIEGAEAEVMAHSVPWIDCVGVLITELHTREAASAFFRAIDGRGFDVSARGENTVARRRDDSALAAVSQLH
jgi:FkbM family methyltransferase